MRIEVTNLFEEPTNPTAAVLNLVTITDLTAEAVVMILALAIAVIPAKVAAIAVILIEVALNLVTIICRLPWLAAMIPAPIERTLLANRIVNALVVSVAAIPLSETLRRELSPISIIAPVERRVSMTLRTADVAVDMVAEAIATSPAKVLATAEVVIVIVANRFTIIVRMELPIDVIVAVTDLIAKSAVPVAATTDTAAKISLKAALTRMAIAVTETSLVTVLVSMMLRIELPTTDIAADTVTTSPDIADATVEKVIEVAENLLNTTTRIAVLELEIASLTFLTATITLATVVIVLKVATADFIILTILIAVIVMTKVLVATRSTIMLRIDIPAIESVAVAKAISPDTPFAIAEDATAAAAERIVVRTLAHIPVMETATVENLIETILRTAVPTIEIAADANAISSPSVSAIAEIVIAAVTERQRVTVRDPLPTIDTASTTKRIIDRTLFAAPVIETAAVETLETMIARNPVVVVAIAAVANFIPAQTLPTVATIVSAPLTVLVTTVVRIAVAETARLPTDVLNPTNALLHALARLIAAALNLV